MTRQLRSQGSEIYRRGQEYEFARQEQDLLRAEMQSRERVHQEARLRASQEIQELKTAQNWCMDQSPRQELRESQFTVTQLTPQNQDLQDKVNSTNDSREFQDVESVCSSRLSYVPIQPVIVSTPCGFPGRDQCQRPDARNLLGTSGDVFENSGAPLEPTTSIQKELLHGRNPVSSFDGSEFSCTVKTRRAS